MRPRIVKKIFIVLLIGVIAQTGEASSPHIQSNIHDLKDLGYTGKGVKVGVLDHFTGVGSHGLLVSSFIRETAPQALIFSADLSKLSGTALTVRQSMEQKFNSFSIKAKKNLMLYALKANAIQVAQIAALVSQSNAPSCYPHLFEELSFSKDEEVILNRIPSNVDVYTFSKEGKQYYAPLASFMDGGFTGRLSGKITSNTSANFQQGFVLILNQLRVKGARIINASITFTSGDLMEAELKRLGADGGVFVSAGGNVPLALGEKDVEIAYIKAPDVTHMTSLWHSLQWKQRLKESDIKSSCLIVGALKQEQQISDYSARAGALKNKFITALVDETGPTGTSFAAPQLTGVLALLQEAYPTCQPKTLAKAILKSGAAVETDPLGVLTGRGRVNPLAAFRKAYDICGVPPQGLKGQKYLLPADFKVEAYLALNPDLQKETASLASAQKEAFGVQHYLQHGAKENRLFKGTGLPRGFQADAYIYAHPDLTSHTKAMTPSQRRSFAYEHYLAHGKTEGRAHRPSGILQTFNPETYLSLHADVKAVTQGMPPEDARSFAYWHFVHHGAQEGRAHAPDVLPPGFNAQRYLQLNPDVRDHTKTMPAAEASSFATWHYIHHGKAENRRYE
ncbi:MAG: S8 family serine peptidase [Alphaproteobacteria bacterium]|jgi:hypothetical protein|nr:S8 family serine peptidase [Alphaproteobacteria bacterium]